MIVIMEVLMRYLKQLWSDFWDEVRSIFRIMVRAGLTMLAVTIAGLGGFEGYLNVTPTGRDIKQAINVVAEVDVTIVQDTRWLERLSRRLNLYLDALGIES